MPALRIIGGLAAFAFFVWSVRRHQRRQISRLNLIISCLLSVGIIVLAIWPDAYDFAFGAFDANPGDNRRLIFLLIVAVIVLFGLILRLESSSDVTERSIRQLVEALAVERFDWHAAAALPEGKRIVTISPAFNEAENVGAVIEAMPDEVDGYRVISLVMDDHSDDGTGDAARKAGALVARLPIRRGGGLAIRVGYEIALQLDADIVVTLDADGQHLPEELPVVIKPIIDGVADHVNGSRILGEPDRGSLVRYLGVHFFSGVVTVLTGQRVTDISSGYRATRADTLRKLILEQDQFWTSEVTIEALRQHARVVEVPVTFLTRRGGESKKPKTVRYAWHFSKAIGKTWLR
jgi:hypothetical protein